MKNIHTIFTKRFLGAAGAAVAAVALITPAIASAQSAPMYAVSGADQEIQGTVAAINGTWNITVADASGYDDSIDLQQGTIINPTGLTLEPGMSVTVDGFADGSNFDAAEIDTPYQYEGPAPVAVYYGSGSWYPGYAYGWGPSFSLAFNIGSNRFEQRSFAYGGEVRHATAPPAGWQNRPHGFVGNTGANRVSYAAPHQQSRSFAAPQQQPMRTFAAPQQRSFAAPQQQTRSFAAPQQQPMRTFAAPQQRSFAAPQQQTRSFAAPQQQRSFAAPASRAPNAARRGGQNDGDHRRG